MITYCRDDCKKHFKSPHFLVETHSIQVIRTEEGKKTVYTPVTYVICSECNHWVKRQVMCKCGCHA